MQAAQALAGAGEKQSGGPNTVLRVIVEHMVYPVTLDVIFQIFSRVGKVMKIVTFTKNNTFQVRDTLYFLPRGENSENHFLPRP